MAKKYQNKDVYTAAIERINLLFDVFEHICVSISGGKDSTVMLQLVAQEARKRERKVDVLFVDQEAMYRMTIENIEALYEATKDIIEHWWWVCLPIINGNQSSYAQTQSVSWDIQERERWTRPLPNHPTVIHEGNNCFDFYTQPLRWNDFIEGFSDWYAREANGKPCASMVGIRSSESYHRYGTIVNKNKGRYNGWAWTTQSKYKGKPIKLYYCYPLYDWEIEDIWLATYRDNLLYNRIYDQMYRVGIPVRQQRIAELFGKEKWRRLWQVEALEADTWQEVVGRHAGVNFAKIYGQSELTTQTPKPQSMTWEAYAIYILQMIGLYDKSRELSFAKRIRSIILSHKKEGIGIEEHHWRLIAQALIGNDDKMIKLEVKRSKKHEEKVSNARTKAMEKLSRFQAIYGDHQ